MENRTVCNDRLQEYMKEVKLLQSYDEVQDLITLATQEKWSYRIFLSEWLKENMSGVSKPGFGNGYDGPGFHS